MNDVTGEIASCSGTYINIWSVNGDLLTFKKCSNSSGDLITECAVSKGAEWVETQNVFITGHKNGSVRVWLSSYGTSTKRDLVMIWSAVNQHTSPITALYVANDLKRLFTGEESGRIYVWTSKPDDRSREEERKRSAGALMQWA